MKCNAILYHVTKGLLKYARINSKISKNFISFGKFLYEQDKHIFFWFCLQHYDHDGNSFIMSKDFM